MKELTPELQALLSTEKFLMADLYSIALVTGEVIDLTSADTDLAWGDGLFLSGGVLIERRGITWRIGVEVDTMELTLYPDEDSTLLRDIARGLYDGATVRITRAFMATWGDIVGTVPLFLGRVADVDATRARARVTVNSHLELLDIPVPRRLFSPGCNVELFSAACGLSRAAYTFSGTVAAGTTTTSVVVSGVAQADGYFTQGYLTLADGATRRWIKSWASGAAELLTPLHEVPADGAAVQLVAGCDKTMATCHSKFANKLRFRGFPFIPSPESAI